MVYINSVNTSYIIYQICIIRLWLILVQSDSILSCFLVAFFGCLVA